MRGGGCGEIQLALGLLRRKSPAAKRKNEDAQKSKLDAFVEELEQS
jgi:hypothetical protein